MLRLEINGECGVPAMIGAVQTFGDLVHWYPHIYSIVPEGIFIESRNFVHIANICKHKAETLWQERVFALLLDEHKINDEIAASMRGWKHSGFSEDNSVRIKHGDKAAIQRLIEYIARYPFTLTRMVSITKEGQILYRASPPKCIPFPLSGDETLLTGTPRNYEQYDPLSQIIEVIN